MPYADSNGLRLHVQRLPRQGPPVVFIHGLLDTLACWYFTLAAPTADLGFDVITYDLRGHGRSDRPRTGYTLGHSTDDLTGLLDALGVDGPVHLVGYSFGGTVAFSYAHRYPGAVASLTVIESEPPTAAWAERTTAGLGKVETALLDRDYLTDQPEVVHKMALAREKMTTTTDAAADLVASEWLLDDEQVRSIKHPVLLVVGGDSDLAARLDAAPPLLTDCRVEVVPGHGHMLLSSAPREVGALVLPWLSNHLVR
ncbi:hydrolase [Alloactinosynnema sp. L-07]|uniref:alpha/beta fold hydrolase n=1 Tax=Alloactinosynnema sp. L-07 TaxID=1653480 RepID=UPI00065EF3D9|nr:alpha/beta hydrolase [Alloactinosynnema sp. L-07]CRK56362.1 hydrolase [Alloactinosynnema sp. L-07]